MRNCLGISFNTIKAIGLCASVFLAGCVNDLSVQKETEELANSDEIIQKREVVKLPEVVEIKEDPIFDPVSLLLAPVPKFANRKVKVIKNTIVVAVESDANKGSNINLQNNTANNDSANNAPLIGLFSADSSQIPPDLWSNSKGTDAIKSLLSIPNNLHSPSLRSLTHLALGAKVRPPKGSGAYEKFLKSRIKKLYDLGFPSSVVAITRSIPRSDRPQWLQEVAIRSMIATGLDGEACRNASLTKKNPSTSAWLIKLRLACVLLTKGEKVAKTQLQRMVKTGQIADDNFAQLMKIALLKNQDNRIVNKIKVHRDFEPELLLLDFVTVTDESNWYLNISPSHLIRLVNSEGIKLDTKVEIAEHSARKGVISGSELAKIYVDAIEEINISDLPTIRQSAGAENGLGSLSLLNSGNSRRLDSKFTNVTMQRADYFWKAQNATSAAEQSEYLLRFLRLSAKGRNLASASEAALPIIRKIPAIRENLAVADMIIVSSLISGQKQIAANWLQLILRDPLVRRLSGQSASVLPFNYVELLAISQGIAKLPHLSTTPFRNNDNNPLDVTNRVADKNDDNAGKSDADSSAANAENTSNEELAENYEQLSKTNEEIIISKLNTFKISNKGRLGLPSDRMVKDIFLGLFSDLRAKELKAGFSSAVDKNNPSSSSGGRNRSSVRDFNNNFNQNSSSQTEIEKLQQIVTDKKYGEFIADISAFSAFIYSRPEIMREVIEGLRQLGFEDHALSLALEALTLRLRIL